MPSYHHFIFNLRHMDTHGNHLEIMFTQHQHVIQGEAPNITKLVYYNFNDYRVYGHYTYISYTFDALVV